MAHSTFYRYHPATLAIGDEFVLQDVVVGIGLYNGIERRLDFLNLRLFFVVQIVKRFAGVSANFGLRSDQVIDGGEWRLEVHHLFVNRVSPL